jgi:hypothetical protein
MWQRAALMAGGLRARLRTTEVAVVPARFGVVRAFPRDERWRAAVQPEADDALSQIDCARTDERPRRQLREAIEGKSDREVLTFIHADRAEVRALGCKARVAQCD